MSDRKSHEEPLWRRAAASGVAASLASAAVLALQGRRELGDGAAPLNGPSQWVWGVHASRKRGASLRHTLVGYAVHQAASLLWSTAFEALRPRGGDAIAKAAAVAAGAALVDFRCTPERFTPGFERRLSPAAIATGYAAFAFGLAAIALARRR